MSAVARGMTRWSNSKMDKIISFTKRRGLVWPSSDIYGGLAGVWDYGPLGLALKKNLERLWWRRFVSARDDVWGIESSLLMSARVWEASGHVGGFSDPLVECGQCHRRARADQIGANCPDCGGGWGPPRQFNMMFKTNAGAVENAESVAYLRPETAQGMFVNFKNFVDSYHPKLPFGLAQSGRTFRNEIAPRDFLFRARELEIMELEYFVLPSEWEKWFTHWLGETRAWFADLGFTPEEIKEIEVPAAERAHYSARTIDFQFRFPARFDEIAGLAYRSDFDLQSHDRASGVDLHYVDPVTGEKIFPHVIEPTFGLGRHLLAVLTKAYDEDELGGEPRVVLRLPANLAPITVAVFPLLKNKPELIAKAREIYTKIKTTIPAIVWDDNGNIGKRYRRQDEIGTPWCVTVDFQTLDDGSVTLRARDTGAQERVAVNEVGVRLSDK